MIPPFVQNEGWEVLDESDVHLNTEEALSILRYKAATHASHSFRIGAAIMAVEREVVDSVLNMLGHWDNFPYLLGIVAFTLWKRGYY